MKVILHVVVAWNHNADRQLRVCTYVVLLFVIFPFLFCHSCILIDVFVFETKPFLSFYSLVLRDPSYGSSLLSRSLFGRCFWGLSRRRLPRGNRGSFRCLLLWDIRFIVNYFRTVFNSVFLNLPIGFGRWGYLFCGGDSFELLINQLLESRFRMFFIIIDFIILCSLDWRLFRFPRLWKGSQLVWFVALVIWGL